MATFTATHAVDMRDIYDAPIFVATYNPGIGEPTLATYTYSSGGLLVIEGTGLDFVDGRPVATTMSSVTMNVLWDGRWNKWNISGTDFHDPSFTGYTDGYDYGGGVGVLSGMNAEVAWWLRSHDTVNGSDEDDFLRGYDGNDTVNGNDGHDFVSGNRGNDTLSGGTGDDFLNGGGGTNIMYGGAGHDTVRYDFASSGVRVDLSLTTAQVTNSVNPVSTDTLFGLENIIGSRFADKLVGSRFGNDLFGGDAKDVLSGGRGNDALFGQAGNDVLKGGLGSDRFVFDAELSESRNVDTVKDFAASYDMLVLDSAIFDMLVAGDLGADNFSANATGEAADADDYILYEIDTGRLLYDADGNGAGAAVQFALIGVNTHPALTSTNFAVS